MEDGKIEARRLLVPAAILIAYLIGMLARVHDNLIIRVFYHKQDLPTGVVMILALLAVAFRRPGWRLPERPPSSRAVLIAAAVLALLLWCGTYWVMQDYPLTRDEHMVVFDEGAFASFRLYRVLPPQWHGYSLALVPAFLLDAPGNVMMVSSYMPGNALMRTAFGAVLDPALMNPALAGFGLVLMHRIARGLFADAPSAVWVALGGYALSAQLLVTAMTTYAMTAHTVLNLLWLALFLRGGRWRHAAAMLVGAWAIGLHQVVFHPLFAGPFILTLLPQRRFGMFAAYVTVYAIALLFWISYPGMLMGLAGISADHGSVSGAGGFLTTRVLPLITRIDPYLMALTYYDLLRFVVWSPAFLLPLLFMAWKPVRENTGGALPLFGGIAATFVAISILLPYQGHGWGYRYFCAVLGNFALLCGYGYRNWAQRDRASADGTVIALGGATALVILPLLLVLTYQFVKPYADLHALVARQTSDFIVVDTHPPSGAIDQVRNRSDLGNRPLIFSSKDLTGAQLGELCRRGSVTLISNVEFRQVHFFVNEQLQEGKFDRLVAPLAKRPCLLPAVP